MPDALLTASRAFGLEDSSGKIAVTFFDFRVLTACAKYCGDEACSLLIPRRGKDLKPLRCS